MVSVVERRAPSCKIARVTNAEDSLTLEQTIERGRFEVSIEGMGYQGEGWVRLADGWLSIRGALPGERVEVSVEPQPTGSRRIWGRLERVLAAADRRSDPHCDRASYCRGCQLRHVSMTDELGIKTGTVSECLEKYAGVARRDLPEIETLSVAGATRADSFRVRSSLTVRRTDDGWEAGIRAGPRLVPMTDCPALADSTRRAIGRFESALRASGLDEESAIELVRVAAPVHGHGYIEVGAPGDVDLSPLLRELDERLPPGFGLATYDAARDERTRVRGPERFRLPIADLRIEVGFGDWFHATLGPAEVLYDAVEEWLDVAEGERVLDAGCGVGTIGLVCAKNGALVTGFDRNPASVETAELNAMQNDLEVRFACAGWERAFRDFALAGAQFDTVVINPMREPLGHRPLAYLPRLGVERVLYLGPSPASASKDIGILRDLGFDLVRVGAANLHPATYHVMLVAMLTRKA